ncbi:MAG: DnaD domain protein, partial [Tetragenococcus koreensis]|nr:DnaD domain protein [Tetragenococcus koreensis]
CIKYELFNEKLFKEFNILTSDGIQKRFFTAVGKRKVGVLIEEFLLIDKEEVHELCPKMTFKKVIPDNTNVIHGKTRVIQESSTQSKVKETKVNKTKEERKESGVNVHRFYQENFGMETPFITEDLEHWINDLTEEVVLLALKKAVEKNAQYSYSKAIMKNWASKGIKTAEAAIAESLSKSKQKSWQGSTKSESLPEWAKEKNDDKDEKLSPEEEAAFKEKLRKIRESKGV